MAKYEVIEDIRSEDGSKKTLWIVLSPDETTFLKFDADASPDVVDATVDVFLLERQASETRRRLDEMTKE